MHGDARRWSRRVLPHGARGAASGERGCRRRPRAVERPAGRFAHVPPRSIGGSCARRCGGEPEVSHRCLVSRRVGLGRIRREASAAEAGDGPSWCRSVGSGGVSSASRFAMQETAVRKARGGRPDSAGAFGQPGDAPSRGDQGLTTMKMAVSRRSGRPVPLTVHGPVVVPDRSPCTGGAAGGWHIVPEDRRDCGAGISAISASLRSSGTICQPRTAPPVHGNAPPQARRAMPVWVTTPRCHAPFSAMAVRPRPLANFVLNCAPLHPARAVATGPLRPGHSDPAIAIRCARQAVAPAGGSRARKAGLVPVTMARIRSSSGGPNVQSGGRPPYGRIARAR
jgi:hypothetical protein